MAPKKVAKKLPPQDHQPPIELDEHRPKDKSPNDDEAPRHKEPHHKKHDRKHDKKHPKKHGKKHHEDKQHHAGKDLRRAYEHLGRLNALEPTLAPRTIAQIKTLTTLAQQTLLSEDPENSPKTAADLLRAAEHIAFASLAQTSRATRLSPILESALNAELDHLLSRAAEHRDKHTPGRTPPPRIVALYDSSLAAAQASRVRGAFRRALEFARAAEALAHVRPAITPASSSPAITPTPEDSLTPEPAPED